MEMTLFNNKNKSCRLLALAPSLLAAAVLQFGVVAAGFSQASAAEVPASTIGPITPGAHASLGDLKHVKAGLLEVSYAELGPADGPVVILLHGWPYDINAYVDVAPALADKGYRVLIPSARGYGDTRFLSAKTARNGQPAALASDLIDFMDALKIKRAVLGGFAYSGHRCSTVAGEGESTGSCERLSNWQPRGR